MKALKVSNPFFFPQCFGLKGIDRQRLAEKVFVSLYLVQLILYNELCIYYFAAMLWTKTEQERNACYKDSEVHC